MSEKKKDAVGSKAGKGGKAKAQPRGLPVFTEGGNVPRWVTAARVVMILALSASIAMVLGIEHGRRLFWAACIASLPLLWVLGGYHLWRRICPLAFFAQIGRLCGKAGERRAGAWLAQNYLLVQFGLLLAGLSLRLVMTNGTPEALAGFLVAVTLVAIAVGFFYTGKTWCNYFCPVGVVEKMYTEPSRLSGPRNSQCTPCTACKKNCPDIDLEQGYWKEADWPSRRVVYYAWPGVVFGFYLYFYLYAGNWAYYFSGAWTLENGQWERWLSPGFFFLPAVPVVVAAPVTLGICAAVSYAVFAGGERVAQKVRAKNEEGTRRVRHRALVLAGFIGFIVFYFFGGQPTVRLAPEWFGRLFSAAVVISASAIFFRRWNRNEAQFVQERFAEKVLSRWEWGDAPPSDRLQDIYLLHNERTRERKARLHAYKEAVREMVADGIVTRGEIAILDQLRTQLGIPENEHKKVLGELREEERQLFDPAYQGSVEQRVQRQAFRRDLEHVVVAAARAGMPAADDAVAALVREHGVSEEEHREARAELLGAQGPVLALFHAEIEAVAALARAAGTAAGEGDDSASYGFLRFLCRWRARTRLTRAIGLLAPIAGFEIGDSLRNALVSPRAEERATASADLAGAVGAERAAEIESAAQGLRADVKSDADATPDPFLAIAADSSPYLRAGVVHILSRFDDERALTAVEAGTRDEDALVRESAYHALGVRGGLTHALVERALEDPDKRVKSAAIGAMIKRTRAGEARLLAEMASLGGMYATLNASARLDSMTTLEKMMMLQRVSILEGLEPDDLEQCTVVSADKSFAAGEELCREGEAGDDIFLILGGNVEVSRGSGAERRIIGRSGVGDVIGEMAVLDSAPRSATVTAVEATRTLILHGDNFRGLLHGRPAMAQAILRVLVGRLRTAIAASAPAE